MSSETFPAGVTDAELLAFIEGEADDALAERIRQSASLTQRARQLERESRWLAANLFRQSCPDVDTLGDYHLGLLPGTQARAIEQHVIRCPHCSHELTGYRDFLGDPPAQPGLAGRILVKLAALLDPTHLLEPALAPAYALRGEEQGFRLYIAGDLQISLDVQEDVEKPGHQAIVGDITGAEPHTFVVDLWQAGEVLDTTPVDEIGGFTLSALLPGIYELIIRGTDVIVHIQSFYLYL